MIKHGVVIVIGSVILVVGLTGLALLQTGVICPTASIGPVNLPEVKSSEPPPESGQQAAGPAGAPALQPAPPAGSGQGPSAQGGQQAPSADLGTQKPAAVPQVGKGERPYQGQAQAERPRTTARSAEIDRQRRQEAGKSASKRYDEYESRPYAHKSTPGQTTGPVVIRFKFDPARKRRLDVAQVHLGDKIRVKVRQVGYVGRRVYFTYSRSLNSPQGAVLKLETMYPFERRVISRRDRGYYLIEVRIYPGNRWNTKPRSFV